MITESIAIQGLYIIPLAVRQSNPLRAVRNSFASGTSDSSAMGFLTLFAMIALVAAVILLIWVFTKNRRSEDSLNEKITDLQIKSIKLRQKNDELRTANEKLKQENTELYRKQTEILNNMTSVETPKK